jgi:hypothetical protein
VNSGLPLPDFTSEVLSYVSISCPWTTGFPATHNDRPYICFKAPQLLTYESYDGTKILFVQTSNPSVRLFFLSSESVLKELFRESLGGKSDLFSKVDNMLKSLNESSEQETEVWFPAFTKRTTESLNWLQGYQVGPEKFVSNAVEIFDVSIEMPSAGSAGLTPDPSKALIFTGSFIFGAVQKRLEAALEIPLFAILVDDED